MPAVEELPAGHPDGAYHAKSRPGSNQEHNQYLILDRLNRRRPSQYLACHHPRQTDNTRRSHGINNRHHARTHAIPSDIAAGLPPGLPEQEALLDHVALIIKLAGQSVRGKGDTGHGVAQDHAKQRNCILRGVPGAYLDHDCQGHEGDGERGNKHGEHADPIPRDASDSAFLPGADLQRRHGQHDKQHAADPQRCRIGKKKAQDLTDEKELDYHPQPTGQHPLFKAEIQLETGQGQQEQQRGRKGKIGHAESNHLHVHVLFFPH